MTLQRNLHWRRTCLLVATVTTLFTTNAPARTPSCELLDAVQQKQYAKVALLLSPEDITDEMNVTCGSSRSLMNDALVGTAEQRVTMVRLLLQLGCKAKDYPDWLVWAASSGEMQLMLLLLGNGADPNVADRRLRMLPLAVATWCDVIRQNGGACIDITRVLMRFGADPNREPPADETWPPHREASPIVAAGSSGKVDQVQLLIDNGADVNKLDAGGMSPLGAALLSEVRREKSPLAGQDGVSVITLLLKHGADPNFEYPDSSSDVPDVEGKTLLTLAADRNLYAVTKLLLQYGANPRKRDAEGWCADERAVGTGNPKLLKLLARWLKDSR